MFSKTNNSLTALFAPIISMCILTIGNGFFTTLTTLQLNAFHSPDWLIGLISSVYFAGLIIASFRAQRFIIRVGHIRAYAAFASLLAVSSLIQGLTPNPIIWLISRYICGYCVAGLLIVIESWCLEGSSSTNKGRIIAFYLFSYYLALALGQLLLKFHYSLSLTPFCIIAGTASLSIIPVCITRFEAPKLAPPSTFSPWIYTKKIPLGVFGSLVSGLVLGGIYTLLPLAFVDLHFSTNEVAYLMGATILGGTLFQLPIGKISDLVDRRLILITICAICSLVSFILIFLQIKFWSILLLIFLLGGSAFVIYPLSINHATDYTKKSDTIAVLSTLSLFYGIGSTFGPIILANLMHWFGTTMIFSFNSIVCLSLILFAIWRLTIRKKVSEKEKANFVAATQEIVIGAEQSLNEELNRPPKKI